MVLEMVPVSSLLAIEISVHAKSSAGTGGTVPVRVLAWRWTSGAAVNENIAGGMVPSRLCELKSRPSVEIEVSLVQSSKAHSNK